MGSCSSKCPKDLGYGCCMLTHQKSTIPFQSLDNKSIVDHFIKYNEHKHELSSGMSRKVTKLIMKYCGKERITIAPPIVTIKSIEDDSIKLKIQNTDTQLVVTGYKIEYKALMDGRVPDHGKTEWNVIHFASTKQIYEYEINELEPCTNYLIQVSARNQYRKYGANCNIISCKTNGKEWRFDTITTGYEYCVNITRKELILKDIAYITAGYSFGFETGIHEFRMRCNENIQSDTILVIGVFADHFHFEETWIGNHDDTHYYYSALGGIYQGYDSKIKGFLPWKKNQLITMTLNCNNWTLTLDQGNRATVIKIEENKKYFPFVSGISNFRTKFEIIER